VTIAHQSRRQITAAAPVDPDQARPGDLLYYPGHVMLALGVDQAVVHAVSRGKPVEVQGRPDRVRRSLRAGAVVDD
jgi:cell wall-associated NlpC family hydrolase